MTLDEISDHLYALAPEDFTAARAVAAKEHRELATAVRALRKPTVGAWLVNTLVRRERPLLDELLALGPALAEAQASGSGAALLALGEQRRQLLGAVSGRAFELAGREATAALRAEVEATLEAALADPRSATAVRSGRLVRTLAYAGFGEVDLDGVVAAPTADAPPRAARRRADVAAAESLALDAAGALDDAVRACQGAQARLEAASAAEASAEQSVRAAEGALALAREQQLAAKEGTRKAAREVTAAEAAVRRAQSAAEKARTTLDRLRRDDS